MIQQYRSFRAGYGSTPEEQLKLARWCQQHHLTAETRAHASQVLAARETDPEVLKMLGLTRHNGQLTSTTELAERKEQDEQAKRAMRHWRPLLTAMRGKIESDSSGEHDEGMQELQAIRDPAAIEALVATFKNRPDLLCEAIRVIGQMPGQEATDALLQQAILSKHAGVRRSACDELKTRSVYGFVPKLIAALSTPVQTRFEVVRDRGAVHFRKTIRREAGNAVVAKTVDTNVTLLVPNPNLRNIIGETYEATILDVQRTTRSASRLNRKLMQFNQSIYEVLEHTVGSQSTRDPKQWWDWWRDYYGDEHDGKTGLRHELLQLCRGALRPLPIVSHSAPADRRSPFSALRVLCQWHDRLDV